MHIKENYMWKCGKHAFIIFNWNYFDIFYTVILYILKEKSSNLSHLNSANPLRYINNAEKLKYHLIS